MSMAEWLSIAGLVGPVLVCAGGVIWKLSALATRVESMEHKLVKLFAEYEERLPQCAVHEERLAEHERQLDLVGRKLNGLLVEGARAP